MEDRYKACMILAAVGDAVGYKNGSWEFNYSGVDIHNELARMGGVEGINTEGWKLSDDTIMHLATAEALIKAKQAKADFHTQIKLLAKEYVACRSDMSGRAAGPTCLAGIRYLAEHLDTWETVSYNCRGGGCGGSMRAQCIGLAFPGQENRDILIAYSIESGRLTHNHPTGFLGAMVSAAFTALAIEGVSPNKWGQILIKDLLPRSMKYLESTNRDFNLIEKDASYFSNHWHEYLKERGLESGDDPIPQFPDTYGVEERETFYKKFSYSGWAGSSGDDSVIIAYDALLGANGDYKELVLRGFLHGGDNDSTGTIAGGWFGALYGVGPVLPKYSKHIDSLEYLDRIKKCSKNLFKLYATHKKWFQF